MFSQRLKQLRKSFGITQTEFAKEFNISQGTIGMWETGQRTPDIEMLSKIARRFNVSIDYLLGETDETKKSPSVSDEDIKFALFGGEGEITDEMWEAVREYAQFVKEKYGKK